MNALSTAESRAQAALLCHLTEAIMILQSCYGAMYAADPRQRNTRDAAKRFLDQTRNWEPPK